MSDETKPPPDFVVEVLGRIREQEADSDECRARERNRAALFRGAPLRVADKYDLGEPLGRGELGSVYRAHDITLRRDVAIKFVRARMEPGWGNQELLREARTLARLSHPNVVHVHEFGTSGDDVFIVMELVDGAPLSRWVGEKARSWQAIVDAFVQAGRGLEAAHAVGVLHGDFKPANVVVGHDGRVRVVDFGLAREVDSQGRVLASADIGGTPGYFAPEQLRGRLDAKSDQFSFCVSLYEGLYGRRPFAYRDPAEFSDEVRARAFARPDRMRVPGWLRRAVERGLSYELSERHPSMTALLEALRRPRRRRVVGASAFVALSLLVWRAQVASPCELANDPMAAVLNGGTRARLEGALEGRAEPKVVLAKLDEVAVQWHAAHQSFCRAHEGGELIPTAYEAKLECLRRGTHRVKTWLAFATADQTPTDRLAPSLDALTLSVTCEGDDVSPRELGPHDEALAEAIHRGIDEAHVALDLGLISAFHRRLVDLEHELGDLSGAPAHAAWWRLQLSQSLVHLGRTAEAETELRRTLLETERAPKDWTVVRGNAMAQLAGVLSRTPERADEALHHAKTAVASLSSSDEGRVHLRVAYLSLAMALSSMNEHAAALDAVEQARRTRLPPTAPGTQWNEEIRSAELHMVEALVLERLERFDEADQGYRAGLEALGWRTSDESFEATGVRHPVTATLLHNWGVFLRRRNRRVLASRVNETAAELRAELGLKLQAADSWRSLANALVGQDDAAAMRAFGRAESAFEQANATVELHILHYDRAIAHQRAGRQERALEDYGRVIDAQGIALPAEVRYGARIGRGTARLALGDAEAARRDLEIALDLEPDAAATSDRAELRFGLARAFAATGGASSQARVTELLTEAAELAAEHPDLRRDIAAWRASGPGQ